MESLAQASNVSTVSADLSRANLSPLPGINMRTREDKETCAITGATLLPPGRILVCDFVNTSIKCVDINSQTVISRLQLATQPWGVAILPGNQAAVTLPLEGKIQFISTTDANLTPVRTIDVDKFCRGIKAVGAELLVSYTSFPHRVEIMDYFGMVRCTIPRDLPTHSSNKRYPPFNKPFYMDVTREGNKDVIYTSNRNNDLLVKMDINGRVLFTLRDREISRPYGITTTSGGQILICSGNDQVNLVSATGQKIKRLLSHTDGIDNPRTVCVSETDGKVFVCKRNGDDMNVYKIN